MHLKFLARGTGSAAAAAAYLLAKRDAAGRERAAVEVLRGDPVEVAAIADALPFKHRYTSGVVAWSRADAPAPAQVERFVDAFEELAWAGLDRDRYAWSAVVHRDHDGGVHAHILAARCDLASGRSLNIAPPGWQKTFDPLRDAFNYEHGWSRPDDPARARAYRPEPSRAYRDAAAVRAELAVEPDPRQRIGVYLLERVTAGTVRDRAGVVAALGELGLEVTRQGRHYVTARHPDTGDRWRLKGALYEHDLDGKRLLEQRKAEPSAGQERTDDGDDASRAAEAWRDVEKMRLRREEHHQARYGGGSRPYRERAPDARRAVGGVERKHGPATAVPPDRGPEPLAAHLRRELGDAAVLAVEDSAAEGMRRHAAGEAELLATRTGAVLLRALDRREEEVCASAGSDRPMAEAVEEVSEHCWDGSLSARAQIVDRSTELLEQDRAEIEREEAALRADPVGEAHLRNARAEVLGAAGREGDTLAQRERIIERAAAMEVDAERWEEEKTVRQEALGLGGMDLYRAHLADIDPDWRLADTPPSRASTEAALDAAESDAARLDRLGVVLSDEAAAARYGEVLEDSPGRFDTSDLDRALAAAEREQEERRQAEARRQAAAERRRREKRLSRLERLFGEPASAEAFIAALDERNRSWRRTGASPADIDQALDAAAGSRAQRKAPPWAHQLVVEAEATFPGAPGASWREAGDRLDPATDAGRHARNVSQMLSDRARARALAAERPEPPAAPGLVKRLFGWLRERMERLLERLRPSSAARPEDGSRGGAAGRARAAAAEREPEERNLAGQLIAAARTAARRWGNTTPATDTLISAAASLGTRRETPAAQRPVLEQINRETAPLVGRSTEAAGLRSRCRDEREAAADQRHQQALMEWSALPRRRRWMARRPERESPGPPSLKEVAAARNELFGVVRAAMAAELERVMPSPRPPSAPSRTPPAETVPHHDESSPPSGALRSDGEVERPAEGKRPVRAPTRDASSKPAPATSPPRRPRDKGHEPSF